MGNRFGIKVTDDGDAREERLTIVLADDHPVMRSGLKSLLDDEGDFSVVAEVADVSSARSAVDEHRPDVLLLDLHMPGEPSLPAIEELSTATTVVVLTADEEPALAREALHRGARGYVAKSSLGAELVNAIRTAADGGIYLNPALG